MFGRKIIGLFLQQKLSILLPICVVINIGDHHDDNSYSFQNHDQTEYRAMLQNMVLVYTKVLDWSASDQ